MILASGYTPVGVVLATATGLIGALLALVKLRGDTDSQAVTQAEGAMEVMQSTLQAVKDERDYWRNRHRESHERASTYLVRIRELEGQVDVLEAAARRAPS